MANPHKTAQKVILAEIAGLQALHDELPNTFSQAVDIVIKTKTYLVVVGVGKSGHIGRKIAASFASTGTPAFFMHPTEAAHGDLGMISEGCSVLALSNSGESQELRAVTAYAKGLKVPVIAITANNGSSLAKAADTVLTLPKVTEACPNGLAPTTSTTNTLALGDALMVSVMEARGFTREDFGRRHPGGKLGLQLQSVSDWMASHHINVPIVAKDAAMTDTVMAMSKGGHGCVSVIESDGVMIGMITDGDLRRAMDVDFMSKSAAEIMTPSPLTLTETMRMSEVVKLFADKRIGNAFVVTDGKPVAVIEMKSLLADGYV